MAGKTADVIHLRVGRFSAIEPRPAWLSEDERARTDRFKVAVARDRFLIARTFLREALAAMVGDYPAGLRFAYGIRGKPVLMGSPYEFNLSHSDDLLVLGVVRGRVLGVDVERVRPMPEMKTVAASHFSPVEQAEFFALPAAMQARAFYTIWTRKEAYIKATGEGFRLPLRDFDVTFMPDDVPRLRRAEGDDPARWSFIHLEPAPGYIAAICLSGSPLPVLPTS
jgi:4'-phosphopantetheinyl transferase